MHLLDVGWKLADRDVCVTPAPETARRSSRAERTHRARRLPHPHDLAAARPGRIVRVSVRAVREWGAAVDALRRARAAGHVRVAFGARLEFGVAGTAHVCTEVLEPNVLQDVLLLQAAAVPVAGARAHLRAMLPEEHVLPQHTDVNELTAAAPQALDFASGYLARRGRAGTRRAVDAAEEGAAVILRRGRLSVRL